MLFWHLFTHFIFSPRAGSLIRRIAWLSMISISLSVLSFLVVLFVMSGMRESIEARLIGLEPHLYITIPGVQSAAVIENHPVAQRLKEDPRRQTYLFEAQDLIVRSMDGQFRGAISRGMTSESLQHMTQQLYNMEQERLKHRRDHDMNDEIMPADPDMLPTEGEIIMGVDLARALGVFEGDSVTLIAPEALLMPLGETPPFEKVRIHRIISTNIAELDAQYIFYQRGMALRSLQSSSILQRGLEVWLPPGENVDRVKSDLMKFDGVQVETWMERNSALFFALKLERLSIGLFLGLAALIAGCSILTVLTLLMSQKKRDIAILRTIGLSGPRTVKVFTQLGMCLAGFGVVSGAILGTVISLYIEYYPIDILPDIYYDSQIPAQVNFGLVFWVLIVSAGIAFFGAWIPARAALEIEPSQALRAKN